jgi:hypothetical protein
LLALRAIAALPPAADAATTPRIAWRECGDRLQCARVPVPLDWARPDGPKISLALARHLASRPE